MIIIAAAIMLLPRLHWNLFQFTLKELSLVVSAPPLPLAPDRPMPAADNGRILFSSNRNSPDPDLEAIFLMDADGGNLISRFIGDYTYAVDPTLSPDCTSVALAGDSEGVTEIYAGSVDHAVVTRLTDLKMDARAPVWSPNGRRIAFQALDARSGQYHIYVMDADGQNLLQPTRAESNRGHIAWSPDGNRLVFSSAGEIALLDLSTGNLSQVTDNDLNEYEMTWSPDGEYILFTASPTADAGAFDLYTLHLKTGVQSQLTGTALSEGFPAWSSDGAQVAFMAASDDGTADIYVMSADGGAPVQLTANQGRNVLPIWSPDGRRIAFSSDRDGDFEIYVIDADGRNPVRLTDNEAKDIAWAWR